MFVRSNGTRDERRRGLWVLAGVVFAVYLTSTGLATVWTDFLWFRSVGYVEVWRIDLLASVILAVAGFLLVAGFVWGNLVVADRLSPRMAFLEFTADEELVERFREWVEPRLRLVRLGTSVAMGLLLGLGWVARRDQFLLFLNGGDFGTTDPQFGMDLGFFVFRLPIWAAVADWAFTVVLVTGILVTVVHYLNGGIRLGRDVGLTMRRGVKTHLSVLLAALALLRAVDYRLDAYRLVLSPQGFFGAGYTDVNARLPALELLVLVSVVAAVLFLWNIRRPGWTLAAMSAGAWVVVSLAAAVVYPAVVQRFQVNPNELARERPYIERNIAATRAAYGLEQIEVRSFSPGQSLDAEAIEANRLTIDNLRMWDPEVLVKAYRNLQEIRPFYRVDRVDTDRYLLDGVPTQVMIAARELEEGGDGIPADWQNQRLIYTHGYGVVLSPANVVEADGQPSLLVRDLPPVVEVDDIELEQSRIYFGETYQPDDPVIVRTGPEPQEVDYPLESGTVYNEYDGSAGVEMRGLFRRLAFALRYRDLNMLISSQLRPDSRILMERNIAEMVHKIAPFLAADADPYPVIADGRVVWVLDLYTYTSSFPYSQPVTRSETARLAIRSGLPVAGFNYVRNSVKATIDAYDGTIVFYLVDPDDPIAAAWAEVYPNLFRPASEMPAELVEHLRYPQDLFKIQSEMYLDYHMTDADEFFRKVDSWAIPQDPSTPLRSGDDLLHGDQITASGVQYLNRLLPSYVMVSLPAEDELSYVLMQSFTPRERFNMSSILVADSTPGRYGRLVDFRLPRGSLVEGPGQVGNRIDQDDEISSQFTLWRGQGSEVLLGDMLVVPVDESILYVQPVYLEAQAGGLPEFRRVIVVFGDRLEWDDTLDGALAKVFGAPIGGEEPDDETPPPVSDSVDELLRAAAAAFERADQALRSGDLAEYQRLVEEARSLVEEAISRLSGTEASGPRVQPW
jgi:uncharacterized membrane protein (UPF0182 family)